MASVTFPPDFRDFLQLLNENEVRYLLIGGYAVGYHGYPRATLDMDIWIAVDPTNAEKMVEVMVGFGFAEDAVSPRHFLEKDGIVRMGVPPLRLEVLKEISGVDFETCYANRVVDELDGLLINIISLPDLRKNKKASGRHKDLNDLENLPSRP